MQDECGCPPGPGLHPKTAALSLCPVPKLSQLLTAAHTEPFPGVKLGGAGQCHPQRGQGWCGVPVSTARAAGGTCRVLRGRQHPQHTLPFVLVSLLVLFAFSSGG